MKPHITCQGRKGPGILRTPAQHKHANVGIYAAVLRGGRIRRGEPVRLV
jgi:MOSC domain-containing protein YiiM